jgi:release factor glutamine methyltransferase
MSADAQRCFDSFVERRIAREPVAYIIGHKEFFSLDFEVNPAVLIPRPETETLVATSLELLRRCDGPHHLRALEIGAGSGAIVVTIAVNEPHARLVATDISAGALAVARRNAVRHGVAGRIRFELADLWPRCAYAQLFDLVISNPPYIPSAAVLGLAPEITKHEPRAALDGGPDGLDFYRRIAANVRSHVVAGGSLLVEIGVEQADEVIAIFQTHGADEISTVKDLGGQSRVILTRFP